MLAECEAVFCSVAHCKVLSVAIVDMWCDGYETGRAYDNRKARLIGRNREGELVSNKRGSSM